MPDQDLLSIQSARDLVEAAYRAHSTLGGFSQEKIDELCEVMALAARQQARRLAQLAHDETGYGNVDDKTVKNLFAAVDIHRYFRGLRTVGVVRETPGVIEIAAPRGVVAAIIPSTNPTSTAIFKILIAVKSRNCVVLSPHPGATRCVVETVRVMREAGVAAGLPEEAIGCLEVTSAEGTEALMKHRRTAVILATGGLGLVRAAYSSGKPAFGVGPGNVPAFIEKSADVEKAVRDILAGKTFDYGTICASEQAVIVDRSIAAEVRARFTAQGAFFVNEAQAEALARIVVTPNRQLSPRVVGQSAETLARWAGINVPNGTRCLIAELRGVGRDYPLSMEKLSPILAWYAVDGMEEGSRLADQILHYGGMGHTASIHTRNREIAIQYGQLMPAARIIVNSPSTHGAIGFSTDLAPSMTLGCGSWGGNVTSDNISPLHLMDIKRVAFETRPVGSSGNSAPPAPQAPLATPHSAASPGPSAFTGSNPVTGSNTVTSLGREALALLVDRFLATRQAAPVVAPAPAPATIAVPPVAPEPKKEAPRAVDFVSEEDVRLALRAGTRIRIDRKTIVTPAARDYATTHDIFDEA